jgi:hypothetical protein
MGQYWREKKAFIQADLAYRLGVIVRQYDSLVHEDNPRNYNSALYLSVLQTLLTSCWEMIKEDDYTFSNRYFDDDRYYDLKQTIANKNQFGLHSKMIIEPIQKRDNLICKEVLHKLRNAMSHPTLSDHSSNRARTGYTSIVKDKEDMNEKVSEYLFVCTKQDEPTTKIVLSVKELKDLVLSLSLFLSQPYQKKHNPSWEPNNFNDNIFDAA